MQETQKKHDFALYNKVAMFISLLMVGIAALGLYRVKTTTDFGYQLFYARQTLAEQCIEMFDSTALESSLNQASTMSVSMEAALSAITDSEIADFSNAYAYRDIGDAEIAERVAAWKAKQEALPDPAVKSQMASRPGMIGRLTIPSLGINVALFASNSQTVVDAADSAACFGLGASTIIGDHQNQGFSAIRGSYVGMTAYIDNGTTKQKLTCTGVTRGTNTGYDLLDSSGASVTGHGGYIMYTCNSNWQDVTIVFFS